MLSGNRHFVLLIVMIFPLIICQYAESAATKNDQVKIEKIGDTDLSELTLTPKAAERLDIKTTKVREEPVEQDDKDDIKEKKHSIQKGQNTKSKKVIIPYSALFYDANGEAWVYTSPKPLTFVRHRIVIDDFEDDDYVVLSDGPPIGTEVVTVGVAELYGAEKGIGK